MVRLRYEGLPPPSTPSSGPDRLLGHAAGLLMTYRSSNRGRNAWVVSLLDVQPEYRVLEIGFGSSLAILGGSVDELPSFDAPFERSLAVNPILFWNEPEARLRKLRRLGVGA